MNKQILFLFFFCYLTGAELPPHASYGYLVYDLQEDRILASKNESQYFVPASLTKLFTASKALKELGPYKQFKTSVLYEGTKENQTLKGNLYLDGEGDPLFDDQGLDQLARAVKTLGIHTVQGKIILLQKALSNPHFEIGDLFESYATDHSLLNLNHNLKKVELTLKENSVILSDPTIDSKVSKAEGAPIPLRITSSPLDQTIVLSGSIQEDTVFKYAARPLDQYIKESFIEKLKDHGIAVIGEEVEIQPPAINEWGEKEDSIHFLAAKYSKQLGDLCSIMLRDSDNLIAETINLHLSKEPALKLVDGSGISRHNKLTCEEIVSLLQKDWQLLEPYLPIAGVNGTLKSRFNDTFLEKRLFAKTGGMEGVVNLAGFWINREGHPILFAFMINNSPLTWSETKEKVDSFLIELLKPYD